MRSRGDVEARHEGNIRWTTAPAIAMAPVCGFSWSAPDRGPRRRPRAPAAWFPGRPRRAGIHLDPRGGGHLPARQRGSRAASSRLGVRGRRAGIADPAPTHLRPPGPPARRHRPAALWGDVGPCLALHRADLHEILTTHGDRVPQMGLPVQHLSQRHDTVTVGFNDGTTDHYDLVIGADGVHSTVRQLAVCAGAVRPVGQLAWRFVTECPPGVTTWTVLLGRHVTFLAVPIGRGQVYCYCDAPAESAPRLEGDDVTGRLVELLTGFAAPVPAILDTLGPDRAMHVGPIEEVTLHEWSRGSVVLLGDAAHAMSPNMAEGAAMALKHAGTRGVPYLGARHRADGGELPGSAPPTHAMGPRPDAPPGSHSHPATRASQHDAAQMGREHLPRQLPPACRSPMIVRHARRGATARSHRWIMLGDGRLRTGLRESPATRVRRRTGRRRPWSRPCERPAAAGPGW